MKKSELIELSERLREICSELELVTSGNYMHRIRNCTTVIDGIANKLDRFKDRYPKLGHIIDDNGIERKVLGRLPITADGIITMPGIEVYHPEQDTCFHLVVEPMSERFCGDKDWPIPEDCNWIAAYSYYEVDTGYSQYEIRDLRTCYSTKEGDKI